MTIEDYKLAKISLAKKITQLCVDFLKETGDENISMEVTTGHSVMTTDQSGRTCYGKTITVGVDTWKDDEDDFEDD